jgi:predicted RNA-binding protein YlqC (UPF0109 family)
MKRLSLQWRITLLTALLIACACVCMNLLLYRTGATGMDALNGFMMQYQPGSEDSLTIEIPQEEMSSLLAHFSQEVYDAKVVFGRKGWCITAVVTILSAAIAYFVSGRALKPLQKKSVPSRSRLPPLPSRTRPLPALPHRALPSPSLRAAI